VETRSSELQARHRALGRATRLEVLTVGWNVVEGLVGVAAALASGSVALLGFGIDSFVESASAGVLLWRLGAERRGDLGAAAVETLDHRARRLVALSLFGLALFVAGRALWVLAHQERPGSSPVGIALTSLSLLVMWWLARAKQRSARELGSRALAGDAFQTTACFWLSLVTMVGIGANAALGWWWADPVAALGMTWFIAREGREQWRGDAC